MRIATGTTDQIIHFVAIDSADNMSRKTGLSGFTVYRARNGAAAVAMTTPTVAEVDAANMPGVYTLLLDEDMIIGAGNDTEQMAFHIAVAGMLSVTQAIELFNPDALLDSVNGVETGYSVRHSLRFILAFAAGKLSGAATSTVVIRDINDTKDRISATVDANGNRTAITLDKT